MGRLRFQEVCASQSRAVSRAAVSTGYAQAGRGLGWPSVQADQTGALTPEDMETWPTQELVHGKDPVAGSGPRGYGASGRAHGLSWARGANQEAPPRAPVRAK